MSWSSIPASSTSSRSPARSRAAGWAGRVWRRGAGPVAVVVPAPAVLVDQPGGGVPVGADLGGGDLGGLQGRGHHHQPMPRRASRSCVDRRAVVLPAPAAPSTTTSWPSPARAPTTAAWVGSTRTRPRPAAGPAWRAARRGARGEREVALDRRGPAGEVSDRTCSGTSGRGQQRTHACGGPGGDVLGELDPGGGVGDQVGLGEQDLDLAADVGGVPGRPLRPEPGDRPGRPRRPGRSSPTASPEPAAAAGLRRVAVARGRAARRSTAPPARAPSVGTTLSGRARPTPAGPTSRSRGPGSWPGARPATRLRSGRRCGRSARSGR